MIDIQLVGTTSTAGAATIVDTGAIRGYLERIEWKVGTLSTTGTSAVVSVVNTPSGVSETLLTLSTIYATANGIYYPRTPAHNAACVALTAAAGGDCVRPLIAGTLQCVIAGGGSALTGGAIVYIDKA
jgi:hypothetical protein